MATDTVNIYPTSLTVSHDSPSRFLTARQTAGLRLVCRCGEQQTAEDEGRREKTAARMGRHDVKTQKRPPEHPNGHPGGSDPRWGQGIM